MNGIWLLVGLGGLVWFWLDAARARELATELARNLCAKRGLQFLDETVNQTRFGLRWTSQGLRLRRMFSFDFSMEGMGRRSAWLILRGTELENYDLGLPKASEQIPPVVVERDAGAPAQQQPPSAGDTTVVPFKRPKR